MFTRAFSKACKRAAQGFSKTAVGGEKKNKQKKEKPWKLGVGYDAKRKRRGKTDTSEKGKDKTIKSSSSSSSSEASFGRMEGPGEPSRSSFQKPFRGEQGRKLEDPGKKPEKADPFRYSFSGPFRGPSAFGEPWKTDKNSLSGHFHKPPEDYFNVEGQEEQEEPVHKSKKSFRRSQSSRK